MDSFSAQTVQVISNIVGGFEGASVSLMMFLEGSKIGDRF